MSSINSEPPPPPAPEPLAMMMGPPGEEEEDEDSLAEEEEEVVAEPLNQSTLDKQVTVSFSRTFGYILSLKLPLKILNFEYGYHKKGPLYGYRFLYFTKHFSSPGFTRCT